MANYNYDFWSKEREYQDGGVKQRAMQNTAIDSAMAERIALTERTRKEEDRQRRIGIMNYNMGQMVAKDMNDLNIVGNSGVVQMDQVLTAGSRAIADQADYLTQELKRTGDYASYASAMAKVKGEVTQMAGVKNAVGELNTQYDTMKANGTISDSMSDDMIANLEALQGGSEGKFEMVDNSLTWVGKNIAGKEYRIAASEFTNLKNKLIQEEDMDGILKNAMKVQTTTSGNILDYDQEANGVGGGSGYSAHDFAMNSLDETLNKRGEEGRANMVRGLLVDQFGEDRDEIRAELSQPGGMESAMKRLESKWDEAARSRYGINQHAASTEKRAKQNQYEKHLGVIKDRRELKHNKDTLPGLLNNLGDTFFKKDDRAGALAGDPKAVEQFKTDIMKTGITNLTPIVVEGEEGKILVGFKGYNPNMKKGENSVQDFRFNSTDDQLTRLISIANDILPAAQMSKYTNQILDKDGNPTLPGFARTDAQKGGSRNLRSNQWGY